MFQNICICSCFIGSLLFFNSFWKRICISNTTNNYIEPSVVAGILVGGYPFILHMSFLPDEYQDSYNLINPYIIIGYTTVIYHSIRRYLEIVKKTDGNSKHPILWGLQTIDPIFVNYVSLRFPLILIINYICPNARMVGCRINIVYIIVFGTLYYCKFSRKHCETISLLSALGIIFNIVYEAVYRDEWYLRYNCLIFAVIYGRLIYEWDSNRKLNKKTHIGNTYPVLSMYISDIVCGFIIYRSNYNYLGDSQMLTF